VERKGIKGIPVPPALQMIEREGELEEQYRDSMSFCPWRRIGK